MEKYDIAAVALARDERVVEAIRWILSHNHDAGMIIYKVRVVMHASDAVRRAERRFDVDLNNMEG